MKPEACPNPEELRSFVRCNVSEQQADSISEHLEHCPACEETVVGLERDGDTIADRIKQAAAQPTFAHEPECQQLMQSLLDGTAISAAEPPGGEAPFQIAESLRDYQIVAKLGEGGMGAVYKAVHRRLKKTVALKVLPTNRIGDKPAVARFEREMEVLGQLNHPHIVQALDAGEHEGQHYLVMEYVEGCDLSDIVKRCSTLSIADACLLISQAAEGLQYAHEHGFVHRDIKPSNLMLAITGSKTAAPVMVKILDLGLARALDQRPDAAAPQADLTTTGQVMGTLDYMAPEQGGDAHQVDIRADIYSLGATLYKLLTGDSPYAEHSHKPPLQRLMAIAHHEPPAIRTKRPGIPEKLAAIVHRMLAKKPEQRFATPADVVQALAPFCAGADLAALVVPSGATRVLDSKTQTTTPLAAAMAGGGTGRRLRMALAGMAAVLALAAVIVMTTRKGTVEVASPDGKLPDDIKVIVTRGGEEVELLQAENQWSAKIVNGEYKVELRGGEDRFDIEDSKLTVSRMGRAVVTVTRRPAVASKTGAAAVTPQAIAIHAEPPKPTATKPAPLKQAGLTFNGEGDHVTLEELPYDFSQQFTVEAIVTPSRDKKLTSQDYVQDVDPLFAQLRPKQPGVDLVFDRKNGGWYVVHALDGGRHRELWFKDQLLGRRHHIALVSTEKELRLYLDGRLMARGGRQLITPPNTNDKPLDDYTFLGRDIYHVTKQPRHFAGHVEVLRISSVARYDEAFTPAALFEPDAETLALYLCDQDTGDELIDRSEHKRHGRINGAKWVPAEKSSSKINPN